MFFVAVLSPSPLVGSFHSSIRIYKLWSKDIFRWLEREGEIGVRDEHGGAMLFVGYLKGDRQIKVKEPRWKRKWILNTAMSDSIYSWGMVLWDERMLLMNDQD